MLLALEPDNWAHLVATSPDPSCTAPLESIRRASLELLPPRPLGHPRPLPGDGASPERNDADWPSTKLQADSVHVTHGVKGTAKAPDGHAFEPQEGFESNGAWKVDRGRNGHDDVSLSSGGLLGGDMPSTTGGGLSDGGNSYASAGRGSQSPADAAG